MYNRPRLACALGAVCTSIVILSVVLCSPTAAPANQTESDKLRASLKALEPCVVDAVFSFLHPRSYLPTTSETLAAVCERQSEAFKCVKEKSAGTVTVIRRGLALFVSSRKKANKKYCSDLASGHSQRALADFKCVMEKRFSSYRTIEAQYVNTLFEIERRNFNNSKIELKYFCCANHKYRKEFSASSGQECPMAERTMQEIISSTVPDGMALICDEEEKMAKTCNELEPIKVSSEFDPSSGHGAATTGLFLVATLGESN